jgi:hypothetical protein
MGRPDVAAICVCTSIRTMRTSCTYIQTMGTMGLVHPLVAGAICESNACTWCGCHAYSISYEWYVIRVPIPYESRSEVNYSIGASIVYVSVLIHNECHSRINHVSCHDIISNDKMSTTKYLRMCDIMSTST